MVCSDHTHRSLGSALRRPLLTHWNHDREKEHPMKTSKVEQFGHDVIVMTYLYGPQLVLSEMLRELLFASARRVCPQVSVTGDGV